MTNTFKLIKIAGVFTAVAFAGAAMAQSATLAKGDVRVDLNPNGAQAVVTIQLENSGATTVGADIKVLVDRTTKAIVYADYGTGVSGQPRQDYNQGFSFNSIGTKLVDAGLTQTQISAINASLKSVIADDARVESVVGAQVNNPTVIYNSADKRDLNAVAATLGSTNPATITVNGGNTTVIGAINQLHADLKANTAADSTSHQDLTTKINTKASQADLNAVELTTSEALEIARRTENKIGGITFNLDTNTTSINVGGGNFAQFGDGTLRIGSTDVLSSISSAQSTADAANTLAGEALNAASIADGKAVAAQQTANEALSSANQAHGRIDALTDFTVSNVNRLDGRIDAETARAVKAEKALDVKIDAETTRAKAEEKRIDVKLDKEIETRISEVARLDVRVNNEIARATAEEKRIDTKLDNEIARAQANEKVIAKRVTQHARVAGAVAVNTLGNALLPEDIKAQGYSVYGTVGGVGVTKSLEDGVAVSVATDGVSVSKSHDVNENIRVQGSIGSGGAQVGVFGHVQGNGVGFSTSGPSVLVANHVIPLTPQGFVVAALTGAINGVTGKTSAKIAQLEGTVALQAKEIAELKAMVAQIVAAQAK